MTRHQSEHDIHLPDDVPDPAPAPLPKAGARGVLLPVAIGSIIGTIFVVVFVALFHAPSPHDLPIAVVGSGQDSARIAQALDAAQPGGFAVETIADEQTAVDALEHREVYGVYLFDSAELRLAGANGPTVKGLLTGVFTPVAAEAGDELTVIDAVPTALGDSIGLSTFYAGFGVVLAGFLFGQITYGMAPLLPLRRRLLSIGLFSVLIGIVVALIAGNVGFDALPGNTAGLALVIALMAGAVATTTVTIIRLTGPAGPMISAVLLLILGNATGGGTLPVPFLPSWLQWASDVLPVGVGIQAIKGISYFHGNGLAAGIYVPLIWIAACVAVLVAKDVRANRAVSATGAATR
ncbi:hypothetical protein [Rhodococcus sp. ACT016]|uniref:hypothetical protein n=1 Tax=Rhodococcus sp. ACT016 TaxID=3134808 RepID=UPI003D272E3F